MSRTLVWDNLEQGRTIPVCSWEDVIKLEEGAIMNDFSLVNLGAGDNEYLSKVFEFKEPSSLPLFSVPQFVVAKSKRIAIDTFITDKKLASIADEFFLIIATINKQVSAIRCHKAAEERLFGPRLKNNYEKDEKLLAQAIQQYRDCSLDNGTLKASIVSISFSFSHKSKAIKVTNNLLLRNIMSCIMKCYNFEGPPISYDFKTLETSFKQSAAKGLFDFFQFPGTNWYIKKKVDTYAAIVEIFELADVKIGEIGEFKDEVIETWLKRVNTQS